MILIGPPDNHISRRVPLFLCHPVNFIVVLLSLIHRHLGCPQGTSPFHCCNESSNNIVTLPFAGPLISQTRLYLGACEQYLFSSTSGLVHCSSITLLLHHTIELSQQTLCNHARTSTPINRPITRPAQKKSRPLHTKRIRNLLD